MLETRVGEVSVKILASLLHGSTDFSFTLHGTHKWHLEVKFIYFGVLSSIGNHVCVWVQSFYFLTVIFTLYTAGVASDDVYETQFDDLLSQISLRK